MKTILALLWALPALSWAGMGNTSRQNPLDATVLNETTPPSTVSSPFRLDPGALLPAGGGVEL